MSSALGYGNVTGHFFVWRVYEAAIFDLSACLGAFSARKKQLYTFVIGGRAIAMADGIPEFRNRRRRCRVRPVAGSVTGPLFFRKDLIKP